MSLRDLARGFAIWPWEIEQAAELGWLRIVVRSRSSWSCSVRQSCAMKRMLDAEAKKQIEPEISARHRLFAMRAVYECCPGGSRFSGTTRAACCYTPPISLYPANTPNYP
jgi:hypothetical protein